MPEPLTSNLRPTVSGKFFRVGEKKFYAKGATYGPFAPNTDGEAFPSRKQALRDFAMIRKLGANVLRIYHVPPRWFLDLAAEHDLKLLIDICWDKHVCFLDSPNKREQAKAAVRNAVQSCARHPAVFAYSVVNEIPPDIVRWSGAEHIEAFIDELVAVAKDVDPECLCTFGNYPPTEFLVPHSIDFFCFNVYLHNQRPFENYLARLQMIANEKPLVLGELGIDTIREGEAQKCEMLAWMIESSFRGGVAGTVIFSFTDEWFKDGREVMDWGFGLVTRERHLKDSYSVVQEKFVAAPFFPLPRTPIVSVVVACYNGGRTLQACLDSLMVLNYPNYEVILVDDGSTDITPQVASLYKNVRYFRQGHHGLSVARNAGIDLAAGEVVAFTDADCRADEHWLYYIVSDLLKGSFVGVGGHNFLPPDDSPLAAAVMAAPGGPAHVMLTDRDAEHIPGCNMAFYKWALQEIAGFDPIFERAGDDVDICWRLQQRGYKIGFSPPGFVWHYRRSTIGAYLRQQRGYGEAEAMLVRRHPEYFNSFGGSMWQGRIYSSAGTGVRLRRPMIYHGSFGTGFFQSVYRAEPAFALMLCTSLEYHALVTLPLFVVSVPFRPLLPLAVTSMAVSLLVCAAAALQAELPPNKHRFWSRPIIALMFLLQPILRGWARYQGRLAIGPTPQSAMRGVSLRDLKEQDDHFQNVNFWGEAKVDRLQFVRCVIERLEEQGWQIKVDAGWNDFDVEILGSRWAYLKLMTASEPHTDGKQLVRCRLKTEWSLFAKVIAAAMFGFELLVIGFVGTDIPWLWLLLLTVPAFAWFVHGEQNQLRKLIAVIISEVGRDNALHMVNLDKPKAPTEPRA